MKDYHDKIKRINLLQKILDQEVVSLKGARMGDEETVKTVNEEIKAFILKLLNNDLGEQPGQDSTFTEEQVEALKSLANKILEKGKKEAPSPTPAPPSGLKKGNPITELLNGVSMKDMSREERVAFIKQKEREVKNENGR